MKKLAISLICMAILLCTVFAACSKEPHEETVADGTPFTIEYNDGVTDCTLDVEYGSDYALTNIPKRFGYEFLGLYDEAQGGKQYVDSNGKSKTPFKDTKNIKLYAQFSPIEYTLALVADEDAEGDYERTVKVKYDSELPELPLNLTVAHKDFVGWFTRENGKGNKIADKKGVLPLKKTFNSDNFSITEKTKVITLYTYFEWQNVSVTLKFGNSLPDEEVKTVYNTDVKNVVYTTRNSQKEGVLSWSFEEGGEPFTGKITQDTTLYALDWAPAIEFDTNGGKAMAPLVAAANSKITLPNPERENYKFIKWVYADNGKNVSITEMQANGASLKAEWQAMIVFDENGGSEVEDISVSSGTAITLPVPTKDGFLFAGWYTESTQRYNSKTMPEKGIALTAGWYEEKTKTITLIDNNLDKRLTDDTNTINNKKRLLIDLSEEFPKIDDQRIEIVFSIHFKWGNTYSGCSGKGQLALYEGTQVNSDYLLASKTLSHGSDYDTYLADSINGSAVITSNQIYLYYAGKGSLRITLSGGYGDDVAFYDMGATINYPDISVLYL